MKALIVGLLGLTVLAGCATFQALGLPDPTKPNEPRTGKLDKLPAGQGICKANKAVFVILIDTDGVLKKFACNNVGNGKPQGGPKTEQPDLIHVFDPKLVLRKNPVDLGTLRKWIIKDSQDPCYVWVVDGKRYHVCWK